MTKEKRWLIVCLMIITVLLVSRLAIGFTTEGWDLIKWLNPPLPSNPTRLHDGMTGLPLMTKDSPYLEVQIYSDIKGSPDVWEKTLCTPQFEDEGYRSYYVSAPNEMIRVSGEMLGGGSGSGFMLDHPDDVIQIVCWKRNAIIELSRFNAGRR